jgi:hypothetical protein
MALPDELVEQIFLDLVQDDFDEEYPANCAIPTTRLRKPILRCQRVCKQWRRVSRCNWRFKVTSLISNPIAHGALPLTSNTLGWNFIIRGAPMSYFDVSISFDMTHHVGFSFPPILIDVVRNINDLSLGIDRIWRLRLTAHLVDPIIEAFNKLGDMKALRSLTIHDQPKTGSAFTWLPEEPQLLLLNLDAAQSLDILTIIGQSTTTKIKTPKYLPKETIYKSLVPSSRWLLTGLPFITSALLRKAQARNLQRLTMIPFDDHNEQAIIPPIPLPSLCVLTIATDPQSYALLTRSFDMSTLTKLDVRFLRFGGATSFGSLPITHLPNLTDLKIRLMMGWDNMVLRFLADVPGSNLRDLGMVLEVGEDTSSGPIIADLNGAVISSTPTTLSLEFRDVHHSSWRAILSGLSLAKVSKLRVLLNRTVPAFMPELLGGGKCLKNVIHLPLLESLELVNFHRLDTEVFCCSLIAPRLREMYCLVDETGSNWRAKGLNPFTRPTSVADHVPEIYSSITRLVIPFLGGNMKVVQHGDMDENPLLLFPNLEDLEVYLDLQEQVNSRDIILSSLASDGSLILPNLRHLTVILWHQTTYLPTTERKATDNITNTLRGILKYRQAQGRPLSSLSVKIDNAIDASESKEVWSWSTHGAV